MSRKNFQFSLKNFAVIQGIGGGSGLLYEDKKIFLASDDSFVLYVCNSDGEILQKVSLNPDGIVREQVEKAQKPDFEAIARVGQQAYLFGSGSTAERNHLAIVDMNSLKLVELKSLSPLYQKMREEAEINSKDFNIEGVILLGKNALFFNRGNGPNLRNGIFQVQNWEDENLLTSSFLSINLLEINGVPLGFTDAIQVGDYIFFIGSAEDTSSTYDDGEILGSGVGVIEAQTLELLDFQIITDLYKMEGIAAVSHEDNRYEFLLCEDADDGIPETKIFSLTIQMQFREVV